LISTNDTTILAMLSRYPNISTEEQDEYISKIENEENVPLCLAVVGRVSREDLSVPAKRTFDEFTRWSMDRTNRTRNEQISDRLRMKQNRTAIRMAQLHQKGIISDQVMLLYGISGELPERQVYARLTEREKLAIWEERMGNRFGPDWRTHISTLPSMFREDRHSGHNWLQEGF
jgi:hypothetical protein